MKMAVGTGFERVSHANNLQNNKFFSNLEMTVSVLSYVPCELTEQTVKKYVASVKKHLASTAIHTTI